MAEELVLKAQVYMGHRADQFLKSELGQYIVGVRDQEVKDLTEQYMALDSGETERLRALKSQISIAEQAIQWIIDVMNEGETALELIQSEENLL